MNSLKRNIEAGEVVIMQKKGLKKQYHPFRWRRVRVISDTFGCSNVTIGSALSVMFLEDGEKCRQDANLIDRRETEAYQAKYGKLYAGPLNEEDLEELQP